MASPVAGGVGDEGDRIVLVVAFLGSTDSETFSIASLIFYPHFTIPPGQGLCQNIRFTLLDLMPHDERNTPG